MANVYVRKVPWSLMRLIGALGNECCGNGKVEPVKNKLFEKQILISNVTCFMQ